MRKEQSQYWRQIAYQLFIGFNLIFLVQCGVDSPAKSNLARKDKVEVPSHTTDPQVAIPPALNYHLISTKDSNQWLLSLPPGDTLTALLVVNRIDRRSLLRHDTLVVPDSIGVGIDLYSPFPKKVDELSAVRKIIMVSYYAQAFAVYENGICIKWGPTSLGKQSTPTPVGFFATNWKAKRTLSTVDPSWVLEWNFNIANFDGVSLHQYSLPGYPASHGCVRLYREDAYWFYNWADEWVIKEGKVAVYGNPVVIYGEYPYGQRRPWLGLAENNKAMEVSSSALMAELDEFMPLILERQTTRDAFERRPLSSISNSPAISSKRSAHTTHK